MRFLVQVNVTLCFPYVYFYTGDSCLHIVDTGKRTLSSIHLLFPSSILDHMSNRSIHNHLILGCNLMSPSIKIRLPKYPQSLALVPFCSFTFSGKYRNYMFGLYFLGNIHWDYYRIDTQRNVGGHEYYTPVLPKPPVRSDLGTGGLSIFSNKTFGPSSSSSP